MIRITVHYRATRHESHHPKPLYDPRPLALNADRLLPLLGHRLPVAPDAGVPFLLLPRAAPALLLLRRLRVHGRLARHAAHPVNLPVVDDADLGVVGPLALRLGPLEAVHLAVALAA